jgi:hypothetical protein
MIQYNFEAYDPEEQITTRKEFGAVSLDTILQEFQYFLKGAGFEFDGNIQIVPEEKYHEDVYPDLTITNYKINPSYEANHG